MSEVINPPLGNSILEQIAIAAVARHNVVKVSNGYHYDLSIRRQVNETTPDHLYGELYQPTEEPPQESEVYTNTWWALFSLPIWIAPAKIGADIPIDTFGNNILADLHYALMKNFETDHLGGLALNILIDQPYRMPIIAGAEWYGVTFNYRVLYRTLLDNPFVQAG